MTNLIYSTPRRPSPAVPLALLLVLAAVMAACGRPGTPAPAGSAMGASAAARTPGDTAASASGAVPQEGGIEYYSAAELVRIAAALGSSTGRTLGDRPGYKYIEGRRTVDGVPEVHDGWVDLGLVQEGRAVLVTGGHVVGGRTESPGEHRGGSIEGGTARTVAPGDFYVIPAGVPHQYRVAPGDTMRYLTVKVPGDAVR